ncbi:high affinity immunoglobulin epsilon receptor subunit alpha [Ochotona curzoniae]|uniref:high affinity immunoglobulin epsilon receptor subunit alpha n=1 Tax=Ochotona curzoniae TaxID=130825 RepID=UPI001B34EE44|nr:high affinity immunoglobulin epsilon receptor subunit alpha [Ochotona curzoniae]
MPTCIEGTTLLWIVALFLSPDGMLAVLLKSVVSLNPPWNRIFKGEAVTLICNGDKTLEDNSFVWFYNGTTLAQKTSYLDIANATTQDQGEYQCQSRGLNKSDPVYLEVFSDWLLLQVSPNVVTEGKPLFIRCHVWRNWDARKVVFYKNGIGLKYWYENHNISITEATPEDAGTYYCKGTLKPHIFESERINITVIQAHKSKPWMPLFIPLLVMTLFAMDTGLFISTWKQLRFILKVKKTKRGTRL